MSSIVTKNTGKKGELLILHKIINNAEECLSALQNAFIYNSSQFLKECTSQVEIIKGDVDEITGRIKDQVQQYPDLQPYVPIPDHLLSIGKSIEKLAASVNKKITGHILFSDKALRESIFLLQRLIEILAPTSDIILARNTFLSMYVQEAQVGVEKMAMEYATLHEERLIKGVCTDAASVIYIAMLDAIKNIAWHSKEIAIKLAG
jgi:Na+/phosphate symporter